MTMVPIKLVLFVLSVVVFTPVLSQTSLYYTLDPAFVEEYCQAPDGCWFTNTSLWLNSTTYPSTPNSVVNITGSTNYTVIIRVPSNLTLSLASVWVSDAELSVEENTTVNVLSLLSIGWLGTVSVHGYLRAPSANVWGLLDVHNNVTVGPNTTTLVGELKVHTDGNGLFQNVVYSAAPGNNSGITNYGNLTITYLTFPNNTNIVLPNPLEAIHYNTINIPQGTTVSVTGEFTTWYLTVSTNAQLIVNNAVGWIGNEMVNSTVPSVSGNGTIIITNSSYIVTSPVVTVFGSINTSDSSVVLRHFQLANLYVGANTLLTVVTCEVVTATFGTMTPLNVFGLNITGYATLAGNMNVMTYLSIGNQGSLYLVGSSALVNVQTNATVLFGGYFSGNVIVPAGTMFNLTGSNATIHGNVVNRGGLLVLSGSSPLTVFGNVEQNGMLYAMLTGPNSPVLQVNNGSINVTGGSLSYSLAKIPFLKNEKFLVAQVAGPNATVAGAFNGSAVALDTSSIDRTLNVEYSPTAIYVVYSFHVDDVPAWVWVVVALVGAVLIAALVAVVIKCRARRQYQPVP